MANGEHFCVKDWKERWKRRNIFEHAHTGESLVSSEEGLLFAMSVAKI